MAAGGSKSLPTIGFLTVCEYADRGLFGGYLVLNMAGRPLEFHCTVPVRPSRAQEILYGPTLKPFLYGEQIGVTLFSKAVAKPLFVCTDVEPALPLRDHTTVPVVLVLGEASSEPVCNEEDSDRSSQRLDAPHLTPPRPTRQALMRFTLGGNEVAVSTAHSADRDEVLRQWQSQVSHLDLCEPFSRIREAIEEAQRGPGRSAA